MRRRLAIALTLWAAMAPAETARHLQTLQWRMENEPNFGGISGFDYFDDGSRFLAVTDRGYWLPGSVIRYAGRIVRIETSELKPLRDGQGNLSRDSDSEGVALHVSGAAYISMEGLRRIRRYLDMSRGTNLPQDPRFRTYDGNAAFEALAVDNDGVIYTLPERSGGLGFDFPIYRFTNGTWDVFGHVPRKAGFLPVGADFGPDGRFYLLERAFNGFGFRSHVRRFAFTDDGPGVGETLLTTPFGRHGNLEAIAISETDDGLRATLLADDNFMPFQRSEIVEYFLAK